MSKYDEAVRHWAADLDVYHSHLAKNKDCRLDPETVTDVTFASMEGGGCETCSYTYMAVTFTAGCKCGKMKRASFESTNMDDKQLPDLIEEIMQYEPVTIEEHPV